MTAAIMTLTLSELMFPTSKEGWIAHVKAVSELLRCSGPGAFVRSPYHKLFTGFRTLILTEAILSRKRTFLELHEWQDVPFQQTIASSLQRLLSCAVGLPSLLQRADGLKRSTPDEAVSMAKEIILTLFATLQRLQEWEQSYQSSLDGPLFWLKTTGGVSPVGISAKPAYTPVLWFPSVITGTACVFLWAFKIICLTEMEKLMSLYKIPWSHTPLDDRLVRQSWDNPLELSVKICQSMAYFLDDTMQFYGPGAAMFPFRIARGTLCSYQDQVADQWELCVHINNRLSQKGFYIEPLHVNVRV
ncbi:hypothetical protein ABOM_006657 [Aspergillus bombycis]|uniref:C6 finger domain protein n=1 Tax=Aspergillus bombycis TaxID=109264 RepID=A0A1F8A042_9EURO|nr:hypothetical protein ABOM_006657 [Aspergillus bombycis]OGM45092.1 hypothetical protein ABOM_006657 [Aspergillus bombycis]